MTKYSIINLRKKEKEKKAKKKKKKLLTNQIGPDTPNDRQTKSRNSQSKRNGPKVEILKKFLQHPTNNITSGRRRRPFFGKEEVLGVGSAYQVFFADANWDIASL